MSLDLKQCAMDVTTPSPSKRQVITFVMTTQYNGFAYAGFQRQSRTPTTTSSNEEETSTTMATGKKRKRNHTNQEVIAAKKNNKSGRKSTAVVTVQDQIENALHKWTGLSLSTLRVRGAGRTDKGVHATHQVVAFDVPLSLIIRDDDEADNNREDIDDDMKISSHALPLLQESYETLVKYDATITETEARPFIDQWEIRRAISTRLPSDIVIRSIRIWNGTVPFEARQNVACKTYIYRLRFRSIAYRTSTNSMETQTTSTQFVTQGHIYSVDSMTTIPFGSLRGHWIKRDFAKPVSHLSEGTTFPTLFTRLRGKLATTRVHHWCDDVSDINNLLPMMRMKKTNF